MRIIIKHYINYKSWATIYCVGDRACVPGGFISNTIFEKIKSQKLLKKIEHKEIIELFFMHAGLISDVQKCLYYQIKA